MSKHQTNSTKSTIVADALAATPNVTHVRDARPDGHPDVQFHCYLDDEPADVSVIETGKRPKTPIQAAYNATEHDVAHLIVAPDEVTGTRINHWLRAPVANVTGDGVQFYMDTEVVERDDVVAVTAAETTAPAWEVRGTDADADRARVCELQYGDQVLATYNLERETITFKDDRWTEIDRQVDDGARPAIAPTADRLTVPGPATWHPIGRPLTVPSTVSLLDSAVYALPEASGDGLTRIDAESERTESAEDSDYERTAAVVNELLAQRTVASPNASIGYEAFAALAVSRLQAEGHNPSKPVVNQVLTHTDGVTIQRVLVDGQMQQQLCGRAWAVPPADN
jgi:hypothetical protein